MLDPVFESTISPREELLCHETLWALPGMTETTFGKHFSAAKLPSYVLQQVDPLHRTADLQAAVRAYVDSIVRRFPFSVCVHGSFQYPQRLQDARHPVELFSYRGDLALIDTPSVSIVGARSASEMGMKRAHRVAEQLAQAGYTVVSGLAAGIDTAALTSAMAAGGRVIGVIGTPLHEVYPKENTQLHSDISAKHLLISQVPFYRYAHEPFVHRKHYFPRRNATMAALSRATVIVEASEKSGTLTQARAAIQQGRQLFILNSCFERTDITWPAHYEKLGAVRVHTVDDILTMLAARTP